MASGADSKSQRALKVLVIAEAANPEWVSVPLIGWSLAQALGRRMDVHVVTQIRNREAILRAGWREGEDFTAIDSEAIARPLWALGSVLRMGNGKGWTALQLINALSYPYFERLIWRQFGARIKAGEFDVVHRVTPLSPTIPSLLAKRCAQVGVPFVMGPLNGGVPWPKGFDGERRREREWLSYVRGAYKALPGRKASLKHAAAIITGSRFTQSEVPEKYQKKCVYIPENAIDPVRFSGNAAPTGQPLRACFVGRMVPYKGPDMLLTAAENLLRDGRMTLDIVGDGPMLEALKQQAEDAGVSHAVTFHGWLAHDQVQGVLKRCNLMSFPSVREFGGGVVLEAMALGVPALIVDYAGPGELVKDGWGFKVPLGTRVQIIQGFEAELTRLAAEPDLVTAAGVQAKNRIAQLLTWERKAAQIEEVYHWVLGRGEKPAPFED